MTNYRCIRLSAKKSFIIILIFLTLSLGTSCNIDELAGYVANPFINELWENGQYELAMQKNDQLLSKYPKSLTLMNSRAYMLIETGDYDTALTLLDQLLAKDEDNEIALNNKAWALVMAERHEEALTVLDLTFQYGHTGISEFNTQGNAYLGLGRYEEAIASYNKALGIEPDYLNAIYGKGATYYEQALYSQAAAEFEKYNDLHPADISGHTYLGYSYYNLPDYAKAIQSADTMIQKFPDNITGYLLKVDCLVKKEEYTYALSVLDGISDRFHDPNDLESIHSRLGDAYYMTGNYIQSNNAYSKCLELQPDSVYYMIQMGYNYLELKDQVKIKEILENAKALDPGYSDIYNLNGLNIAYQTYYKASIPEFEKALELDPNHYNAALNKAWALYMSKQLNKCIDFCMEASDRFTYSTDFYVYAGHSKRLLYELEDATQLYLKALETSPDDETILASLTLAYFERQDTEKCMEYADKTLAANPNNATALYFSDLIKSYSQPVSRQAADFFMDYYLYANQIENFEEKCIAFADKTNAGNHDVVKFVEEIKLRDDWYTFVITDGTYIEQYQEMVDGEIIIENIDNVYLFKFSTFSYTVGYDFIQFANSIQNPEECVLIVDLRGNGGGLIQGAVDMLDCLLGDCVVCTTTDRNGYTESYYSDSDRIEFKHIYIFIDEYTASASELFTLGLKKYTNRVTVIGSPTVGKGVGQMVHVDIARKLALVTVNFYWNVKEENINQKPIRPDYSYHQLKNLTVPESDIVRSLFEKYQ